MQTLLASGLAALITLTLSAPAEAVSFSHTQADKTKDVKIIHSGFAGNQDIDIERAYYLYPKPKVGYTRRVVIDLLLRNVRPALESNQVYRTVIQHGEDRYLLVGNSERGGAMYLYNEGSWQDMRCSVKTGVKPTASEIGGNVRIKTDACFTSRRIKIISTRTENYYSDSLGSLAAWDQVTVNRSIGQP